MSDSTFFSIDSLPSESIGVFVCYSRRDTVWKNLIFQQQIKAPCGPCKIWVDETGIDIGERITSKIENAIDNSQVAVLLVSKAFLQSSYIKGIEYPRIVNRVDSHLMRLVWCPIGLDENALADIPDLSERLAALPPNKGLPAHPSVLDPEERDYLVNAVRQKIIAAIDPLGAQLAQILASKYSLVRRRCYWHFWSVYEAFDGDLNRKVAIKALSDPKKEEIFDESVQTAALISDHPYLINIYGAWLAKAPHHYVMQFIDGQNLRDQIDSFAGRFDVDWIVNILSKVGHALKYAHDQNIFHRSIRPSNILIDDEGQVFLSALCRPDRINVRQLIREFGERLTEEEKAYLPPEEFAGYTRKVDGAKIDQYQLGLLGYELLTGKIPPVIKSVDSPQGIVEFNRLPDVGKERYDCPEDIINAIVKMASHFPSERFSTLETALATIEGGIPRDFYLRTAKDSYRYCTKNPEFDRIFFSNFYDRFLDICPGARKYFPESTDWNRLHELLKESVLLLLVFYEQEGWKQRPGEPNVLSRLARKHGKREARSLRVPEEFYDPFVNALIETVCQHDNRWSGRREHLEHSWRQAVRPGVDYMKKQA